MIFILLRKVHRNTSNTKVIEKREEAYLKIYFFKKSIKILGHIVSKNNLMMDTEKIDLVKYWQVPNKVVHVQQFIGLSGYYRKFIENFAGIAAPLYNLLRKDRKWVWTQECKKCVR